MIKTKEVQEGFNVFKEKFIDVKSRYDYMQSEEYQTKAKEREHEFEK